jgi:hypothetical protein
MALLLNGIRHEISTVGGFKPPQVFSGLTASSEVDYFNAATVALFPPLEDFGPMIPAVAFRESINKRSQMAEIFDH